MKSSIKKILDKVAQSIYDKKGINILVLDVQGISSMTDFFIIAEGSVDRHVKALATAVTDALAEEKLHPFHMDGQKDGEWIVLDFSDFIVHLLIPDFREKYALERLWKEGKVVDVKINLSQPLKSQGPVPFKPYNSTYS